ncbi:IS3 family transposase [Staphylococcus felis]|uniref:IS3 family transposase n=1 Tax=Staphylococcus felis TaxID=46127 RepID=UPI003CCB7483
MYIIIGNYDLVSLNKRTITLIKEIIEKHKNRIGYRTVTDELRDLGFVVNHKKF